MIKEIQERINRLCDLGDHYEARGINVELVDNKINQLRRSLKKIKYFMRVCGVVSQ